MQEAPKALDYQRSIVQGANLKHCTNEVKAIKAARFYLAARRSCQFAAFCTLAYPNM